MQSLNFARVINLAAACVAVIGCSPKSTDTLLTTVTVNNCDMMVMHQDAYARNRAGDYSESALLVT